MDTKRTFDKIRICVPIMPGKPQAVYGSFNEGGGKHIGWLMPQLPDSRQQPKSAAHKLLENRNAR